MPVPTIDLADQQQAAGASKWGTAASRGVNAGFAKIKTWCDAAEAAVETAEADINTLEAGLTDYLNNTSTSSVSVGTGTKTFVVASVRPYAAGQFIVAADAANPADNWIFGQVTSWTSGTKTLVIDEIANLGTGTLTSWVITGSGPQGPAGTSTVDIVGLTTETAIADGDFQPAYDTSATANRKFAQSVLRDYYTNVNALSTAPELDGRDKILVRSNSAGGNRSATLEEVFCFLCTL